VQFFTVEQLTGKLPQALVDSFTKSEQRYKELKQELDEIKTKGESSVELFMQIARQTNDAFLEWKGANKAVARFLNINWPWGVGMVKEKHHSMKEKKKESKAKKHEAEKVKAKIAESKHKAKKK